MRTLVRRLGFLALAAMVAGCGDREVTGAAERIPAPDAPRMAVGPTANVVVQCPTKLEVGSTAPCVAYGYDANGKYTSSSATSWGSSNTGVATISNGTLTAVGAGTVNIVATVGGITGSLPTQLSVVSATTGGGGTLSVLITGRNSILPNQYCEYYANVSGGTAPYTYSWSQTTGTGLGASSDSYLAKSSTNFVLTVNVTSSNGATGTATKSVSVSSSAGTCAL